MHRWEIAPQVLNVPARRIGIVKNIITGLKTYSGIDFQQGAFFDRNYLVPIPAYEIQKNPKLVQNPGYN